VRVALLIGPCVPGKCGVGDYTRRLREALNAQDVTADLIDTGDWKLRSAVQNRKQLRAYDLLHLQYPTTGFGWSLGPQALSILTPTIATIHEVSQRKLPRKLSLFPFSLRPQHLIFTSSYERRFAIRFAPWIAKRTSVIPVGTNINVFPTQRLELSTEIVYFGLIMPNKGLEQVIQLASLIKAKGFPYSVNIVGQVPVGHEAYFQQLRNQAAELPVVWNQDLTDDQVAQVLNRSSVAYLPYPDGASDRRTSLKSALSAGLAVITNRGEHTSSSLAKSVLLSANPSEALSCLHVLFRDIDAREALSARAVQYSHRYSWERIAKLHLRVYRSVYPLRTESG
jgi:glycosyltransferase involved in cell wall biosynthesis